MHWAVYFADFANALKDLMSGNVAQRFSTRDVLLVVSASLAVGVVLVVWVAVYYRRKAERDGSRRVITDRPASNLEQGERRRRRRRRRPHRPRNPSLHQTGGLPPPRPENQPPKF